MTKRSKPYPVRGCLFGLCFLLALSISDAPYSEILERAHTSKKSPLGETLSWLGQMGRSLGLSSLEFEVHGASLQISEIVAHLGQFLPLALHKWKPTGEVIFDLAVAAGAGQASGSQSVSLDLQLKKIAFSSPDGTKRGLGLEGKIHARIHVADASDQPAVIRAVVELERGEIVINDFPFDMTRDPVRLRARGVYDPQRDRLSPLSVFFHVPSLGEGTIEANLEIFGDPRGQLEATVGPIENRRTLDFFGKVLFGHPLPALQGLSIDGETRITAKARGSLQRYAMEGLIETSVPTLSMPVHQVRAEGVRIRLPFSVASPSLGSTLPSIRLDADDNGRVQIDRIQWRSNEWRDLSVPIAFAQDTLLIGHTKLPVWGGAVILKGARIQDPLSRLPGVSLSVLFENIHFTDSPSGPPLPTSMLNWEVSGEMDFDLGIGGRTTQGPERELGVQFKNFSFSSPDETKLGEGIQGEIHVSLRSPSSEDGYPSFRGDLNLDGGEILLESFYLNLREDPLRLCPHGTYDPQSRRLLSFSIHFHAPTWGEGVATANLENLGGRLGEVKFSLGPIINERALAIFVKEPFGQVSPMVRGLSVSGETFITGEIRGSASGFSLRGLVETSAVDLVVPRFRLEAKALRIRFPFAIDHAGGDMIASREDPDDSLDGFITGDWIRWRSEEWRDVTVSMMLKDDVLFFPHEMKLPILGGAVILEAPRIRNPFEGKRRITLGLRLERLDFSKITNLFLPFAVPGRMEGYFSEISVSQATLETRGKLTVHALGGEIEAHNINGMTPFTRLRKVSMDLLFEDIDLEEASRSFEFGQMGGIIQGEIRGLSFSFGQPESFELEIRSVKRRGVKQYVNAEAVNNLSILSTGSGFSFKKGALQFFKYFPYAKLGIYCKLENDVFTLRGTIHRRGVEYLIRRGLVGGIDVVNQNPDNRIRWRQMLSRLRAIGQGVGGVEVSTGK